LFDDVNVDIVRPGSPPGSVKLAAADLALPYNTSPRTFFNLPRRIDTMTQEVHDGS
jgi:hypothetical protein